MKKLSAQVYNSALKSMKFNFMQKFLLKGSVLAFYLVFFVSSLTNAQNAIVGSGFASGWGSCGSNSNFTNFIAGQGTTYTSGPLTPNGTGNQYWRMGVNWSSTYNQFNDGGTSDQAVTPGTKYSLSMSSCASSGAMYYSISTTSNRYVFKTLNAGTAPTGTWVFFELSATPITVSTVTNSLSTVYASQSPTITAGLSASLPTGQGVYLRYTTNSWTSSTVVAMTGSASTYTASIPTQAGGTAVAYYVFTSGSSSAASTDLTGTPGDADLYTINLNNNSGSNFSYTVVGLPVVTTTATPSSITSTTAVGGGSGISGSNISTEGLVWSKSSTTTTPTLTTKDGFTSDGGTGASFSGDAISSLSAQTLYYIGAYATNPGGSGYGPYVSFYTLSTAPTGQASGLSTSSPTSSSLNLTLTTAATYSSSGATKTGYLLLYNTGSTPTMQASPNGLAPASALATGTIFTIANGTAPTAPTFPSTLTGLSAGTTYYLLLVPYTWDGTNAATYNYLTTSAATANGTTSLVVPTVTTTVAATLITTSGASSGGQTLTGTSITAKGVAYSTAAVSTNPTIANSTTNDGTGTANYTSTLSSLSSQTQYYVRAYATNSAGTGYATAINFFTFSNPATAQPATFTTTPGSSSLTVNWGSATFPGSGATQAGYVVIYSTGTPTLTSANGTSPVAGVGTLINITPTNLPTTPALTTTINSLTNGTTYNLLIVPYTWDGSNATTYNYFTTGEKTTTGTPVAPTIVSTSTGGTWSSGTSWVGGVAPSTSNNVEIVNGAVVTIGTGITQTGTVTVDLGGTLATTVSWAPSGGMAVNGTYQVGQGGFTSSGTLNYGTTGTLSFGQTSGSYGVNYNDACWPSSNGPINVTVGSQGINFGNYNNTSAMSRTVSGLFQTSGTVLITSNTGTSVLTITGKCQINSGGIFSQEPTYSGTASTLIYNNGGAYTINNEWGGTGPTVGLGVPQNVTVQNASVLTISSNRALSGTLTDSSNSTIILTAGYTGGSASINGTLQINASGYSSVAPTYGASSLLYYFSGTNPYGRSTEWSATSGPGYPNNVEIGNNTTLDVKNGSDVYYKIAGNLTIDHGSTFNMNTLTVGSGGVGVAVVGNINNDGNILFGASTTRLKCTNFTNGVSHTTDTTKLSSAVGGDLELTGNFIDNAVFSISSRALFFTGTGTQTISGTAPVSPYHIDYIVVTKSSGIVQTEEDLLVGAPNGGNAITLSSSSTPDIFDLNGHTITIGTSGTACTLSGSGFFRGSSTSNIIINGTGALGKMYFDQTTDGTTNVLGSLTINRTSSGTDSLGNKLIIANACTLTSGQLVLNNSTLNLNGSFTGSSTNNLLGSSASTSTINIAGSGTFGTLYFDQTTPGTTNGIGSLTINRSGVTDTLGNNAVVNSNLTLTAGTFDIGTSTIDRASSGGTLTVANGTTLRIGRSGGTNTLPANYATHSIGNTSTIEYAGASQSIATLNSSQSYGNLLLSGSGTKTLAGSISVATNWTRNSGPSFNVNSSLVTFTSSNNSVITAPNSSSRDFYGLFGGETFYDLTVNKSSKSVTVGTGLSSSANDLAIIHKLTLTTGTLNIGDSNLILTSRHDTTASLATVNSSNAAVSYNGSGRVVVQRYIPNPTSVRTWRFLTAPLQASDPLTISQAWQEGVDVGDPWPGYGTLITGKGGVTNGFDSSGLNNYSIEWFNSSGATDAWGYPTNTSVNLMSHSGWVLFIRGSRSASVSGPYNGANSLTLEPRGKINIGDTTVTINSGRYNLVGNPYPSQIDMTNVTDGSGNPHLPFKLWDPKGFVNYSETGKYVLVKYYATNYVTDNSSGTTWVTPGTVESGESLLLDSVVSTTVNFHETDKTGNSTANGISSRPTSPTSTLATFYAKLGYSDTSSVYQYIDGTENLYYPTFNPTVTDEQDYIAPITAPGSIRIARQGFQMYIDAQPSINIGDTIYYNTSLNQGNHRLAFYSKNFDPSVEPLLTDNYNSSQTAIKINNTDSTFYDFSVTADPLSNNLNRFFVVYRPASALPVTILSVVATKQLNSINVNWHVENELSMKAYMVEKSIDGKHFIDETNIAANNLYSYNWVDKNPVSGANYYRIKVMNLNGSTQYSQVVEVTFSNSLNADISLLQNPVINNRINLQFTNMVKGKYAVNIYNTNGQLIFNNSLQYNGGTSVEYLSLPSYCANGIYRLEITDENNTKTVINFKN